MQGRNRRRLAERADLEAKSGNRSVLTPDAEAEPRQFQADSAKCMAPDAPFEGDARLLDILRVDCVYDDRTGQMAPFGLMGSRSLTMRQIKNSPTDSVEQAFGFVADMAEGKAGNE